MQTATVSGGGQADSPPATSLHHRRRVAGVFPTNTSRTSFVDGVQGQTNTINFTPSSLNETNIGGDTLPTSLFVFDMYEAAFWNVALTNEEAMALTAGMSPKLIRPGGLVSWTVFEGPEALRDLITGEYWTIEGFPYLLPETRRRRIFRVGIQTVALDGALTFAGALKKDLQVLRAGTLSSSGTNVKQTNKNLSGVVAPTGTNVKQTEKLLTGTLTTSGVLATIKTILRTFTGTLTTSGSLLKQTNKSLSGTLTLIGSLLRSTAKLLFGSLTPTGSTIKQTNKSFAGSLTSSSVLVTVKTILRTFTGTLTTSGSILKQTSKSLAGTLTMSGSNVKQTFKTFVGTLTTSGSVRKAVTKFFAGTLGFAGTLITFIAGNEPARILYAVITLMTGHSRTLTIKKDDSSIVTVKPDDSSTI